VLSKLARSLVLASVIVTIPLGCGKDSKQEPAPVEVLPAAVNGSPVSVKFVEFTDGEDGERGMKIKLYNHGDKVAVAYVFRFRYFDANDQSLKVSVGTPFESDHGFTSMSGNRYKCKPEQNNTLEIDGKLADVPAGAVRAEILASEVRTVASDGITIEDWWMQEDWSKWPTP
jgi:hypothetical protein